MNLKIENINKSFVMENKLKVDVLKNLSLEINSGQSVSIIGPSGAGKSTLLHIAGLMDRPDNGSILLDSKDFSKAEDYERSKVRKENIGFIFQMHYLLPEFNVIENVLLPVWENKEHKSEEAKSVLESLGLTKRLQHLPSELSGGEQQRVALARALINKPKILLADEPTGNLDSETGKIVEEMIFDVCKKRNITMLIVTHNKDLAKNADKTIEMRDGKIL